MSKNTKFIIVKVLKSYNDLVKPLNESRDKSIYKTYIVKNAEDQKCVKPFLEDAEVEKINTVFITFEIENEVKSIILCKILYNVLPVSH